MIQGLAACFTGLEDPRETSRCDHQLIDILVIAVWIALEGAIKFFSPPSLSDEPTPATV